MRVSDFILTDNAGWVGSISVSQHCGAPPLLFDIVECTEPHALLLLLLVVLLLLVLLLLLKQLLLTRFMQLPPILSLLLTSVTHVLCRARSHNRVRQEKTAPTDSMKDSGHR